MPMIKRLAFFIVLMPAVVLLAGTAMANGTLTATVVYNGPPLQGAYVYLQSGASLSPREQYYQRAAGIYGPSDAGGNISVSVPEGAYHVRITKRATFPSKLGPPYAGDYTWNYTGSPPVITIPANGAVSLGVVNATKYGQGITISGTVRGASGKALAGWSVKVATAPCESGNWAYAHSFNECGASKYPARTDSGGNYTITVTNAGTYYVYASPVLNFGNPNYPGGYPTCATGVGCEACGDYFYYNCPVNVSSPGITGVNVSVPGY